MVDRGALLRRAIAALGDEPYALIGGQALLLHGHARQTDDVDLLVGTKAILDPRRWPTGDPAVVLRPGDPPFDPLDGVVSLTAVDVDEVDPPVSTEIIVLDRPWARAILGRCHQRARLAGIALPLVDLADLVILKAYAGGAIDRADLATLAERPDWREICAQAEARLAESGPPAARRNLTRWLALLEG